MGQEQKEYTWSLIAKKLMNEASTEELKELEEILRQNPELHYPLQTITDLWNTDTRQDAAQAEQAFLRHLSRMEELHTQYTAHNDPIVHEDSHRFSFVRRNGRRIFAMAAALAGLTLVAVWLYPQHSKQALSGNTATLALRNNSVNTNNGSRTHLTFPDGTKVWLNSGSRIDYEKESDSSVREVNLTGEAFFDVAPNANKPFIIHTTKIDIRVLGTAFNVKSYPADKTTEATLVKGSIEVSIKNRPDHKIILKPNEKIVIDNDTPVGVRPRTHRDKGPAPDIKISQPNYEPRSGLLIETSWVENKLIFRDMEFRELARQMERWYGIFIHFNDPKLEELHFTGIFDKETVRQALEALKLTGDIHSFNYTINGNEVLIHD